MGPSRWSHSGGSLSALGLVRGFALSIYRRHRYVALAGRNGCARVSGRNLMMTGSCARPKLEFKFRITLIWLVCNGKVMAGSLAHAANGALALYIYLAARSLVRSCARQAEVTLQPASGCCQPASQTHIRVLRVSKRTVVLSLGPKPPEPALKLSLGRHFLIQWRR